MIFAAKEILEVFGVDKSKIHFELFTTPVSSEELSGASLESNFSGVSKVKVILDDEVLNFELKSNGKSILENCITHFILMKNFQKTSRLNR